MRAEYRVLLYGFIVIIVGLGPIFIRGGDFCVFRRYGFFHNGFFSAVEVDSSGIGAFVIRL